MKICEICDRNQKEQAQTDELLQSERNEERKVCLFLFLLLLSNNWQQPEPISFLIIF